MEEIKKGFNIRSSAIYREDIEKTAALSEIEWNKLAGKSIMITGASGSIGTYLVDVFMERNIRYNDSIKVYCLSRNMYRAEQRFGVYLEYNDFSIINHDVCEAFEDKNMRIDYIIHAASNAHPASYSKEPVETILANIKGLNNMCLYASHNQVKRVLFLSSVAVYGNPAGNCNAFSEDDAGLLEWYGVKNSYAQSKRTAELLGLAYLKEYNLDFVTARLSKVLGPTYIEGDTNVRNNFISLVMQSKNIVLKSDGKQMSSYIYIADAVSAILKVLLEGAKGETYNIANQDCGIPLLEFVEKLSALSNTKVEFEQMGKDENIYSSNEHAVLNSAKLSKLGWVPRYSFEQGLNRTYRILKESELCEKLL